MNRILLDKLLLYNTEARVQTLKIHERGQTAFCFKICQNRSLSGLQLDELVDRQNENGCAAYTQGCEKYKFHSNTSLCIHFIHKRRNLSRKILRMRIILIDKVGKICYDSAIKE